jgi:hypothetical protein
MKKIILIILVLNGTLKSYCQDCISAADFIAKKYKTHNIIALDEGPHGTIQVHDFLRMLLKSKQLSKTVNYIILEFANSSYQPLLDRYINGENLSQKELQPLWRETTQAHSTNIENPVYLELLTTVRDINRKLPLSKRIRVLAGDPPIDWSKVNTFKEYLPFLSQRDILPSQLAIKYGIDSAKKVLLIFGSEHLSKISDDRRDSTHWSIPFFVNKKYPSAVFTIGLFVPEHYKKQAFGYSIPRKFICSLSGHPLGNLYLKNGRNPATPLQLKDLFDAVFFIGSSVKWKQGQPLKIDIDYWNELNRRSQIIWGSGIDRRLRLNLK